MHKYIKRLDQTPESQEGAFAEFHSRPGAIGIVIFRGGSEEAIALMQADGPAQSVVFLSPLSMEITAQQLAAVAKEWRAGKLDFSPKKKPDGT